MEIVRFSLAALLFTCGLFVLGIATLGLYRLSYVLNRIHASAKCDTLGTMLILLAVGILNGINFTTLKLAALIIFIWLFNPVAVHMLGLAEVLTNPNLEDELEIIELEPVEEHAAGLTEVLTNPNLKDELEVVK